MSVPIDLIAIGPKKADTISPRRHDFARHHVTAWRLLADVPPGLARTNCASGIASHGALAVPCNKVWVTDAMRPGNRIFVSYIGLPDRLDSFRGLRFRVEFKVPGSKLQVGR